MNFSESLIYNNKLLFNNTCVEQDTNLDTSNIKKKISNICPLIDYIKIKYNIPTDTLTYELFIEKLEDIFGNFILCISKDEDNDYFLLNRNIINSNIQDTDIFTTFTTTLYSKNPFKKIFSFIVPQYINNTAIVHLKNIKNFSNLYVKYCTDMVNIVLIYNNKWRIITEKSLDGADILYKNKTNKYLFYDVLIDKKINLDILDKNKIYYFSLIHHKNNSIIHKYNFGSGRKNIYLDFIMDNLEPEPELELEPIIHNFSKTHIQTFKNLDNLLDALNKLSYDNMFNKKITHEGFIIYDFDNKISYKIQTNIYQQIKNIKPLNKNINQTYLELYQENKLKEYLPYFTNYYSEIIHRISMSVRTISKEFLDIYHYLKKNKITDINFPKSYKKILYDIHGIYIDSKKNEYTNNYFDESYNKNTLKYKNFDTNIYNDGIDINMKLELKSITVHDIYHYLKSISPLLLRQIYFDRENIIKNKIINDELYSLFVKNCIYTITQTKLMII